MVDQARQVLRDGRAAFRADDHARAGALARAGLKRLGAIDTPGPTGALAHALWQLLAHAARKAGDQRTAAAAATRAIGMAKFDPDCLAAGAAMARDDLPAAEAILRRRLKADPAEVASIQMLSQVAARAGRLEQAQQLLTVAHDLAPDHGPVRANYATILFRRQQFAEAEALLATLAGASAEDPGGLASMRAAALSRLGRAAEARAIYAALSARQPDNPALATSEGHLAKTLGDGTGAVASYRRALAADPAHGEAWWSLANLKTHRFDDADRAVIARALATPAPAPPPPGTGADAAADDRAQLLFAAARAAEDAGDEAAAFDHYAEGNARIAGGLGHDPDRVARATDAAIALIDAMGHRPPTDGDPAPDPIFIVGLPRSGSTLIEQMLSCHLAVEGTMELPYMPAIAIRLGRGHGGDWTRGAAALSPDEARTLGTEYLDSVRSHRVTDAPRVIDKLPNNWQFVPLIRRILPNARIIEARRDPRDCGWGCFRQHFAAGQGFSYDLGHIGRYWRDAARLMDHARAVWPDAVTLIDHEALLDAPEATLRALLAFLGLPWDAACLDFHTSDRAVRTASAQQVRRPLNRDGQGRWRPHAHRLGALFDALDLPPDQRLP